MDVPRFGALLRLEKRPSPSRAWLLAAPVLAVLLTMLVGGHMFGALNDAPFNSTLSWALFIIAIVSAFAALLAWAVGRFILGLGRDDTLVSAAFVVGEISVLFGFLATVNWYVPFDIVAIRTIFWDPLFGEFAFYYRGQLLVKAAPLVLIAVGLALGFRAGIWNIGAEGQYIIGAICGAGVALALYPADLFFLLPLMALAGAAGGLAWGMIPAILKTRFNTNEILVSLLLVYVAEQILASMALGPMRNPEGSGFPGSRNLRQYDSASNLELIEGTGIHWGVIAALVAVIVAHVLMRRHMLGFQIRLSGQAPRAARFAGVEPGRMTVLCLGTAGALAGLAGLFEVTGPAGQITIDFNVGYGFTAIIVAFLGRLEPLGILLAGLLMALTYIGGEAAQSTMGLPAAAIQAFQGMLLFFLLAVDMLTNYRLRLRRRTPA